MKVICLSAQAQNGKDTVANYLCQRLNDKGGDWTRAAFAASVKKVFCDTFGVDLTFVEEWKAKEEVPLGFDMPIRQSLQFIGDGFRQIRRTIWLDLVFRDRQDKIISDGRYYNEFMRVKQEGGLNILVGRPDKLNDDPNGSEAQIKPYVEWMLANSSEKFVKISDTLSEMSGAFYLSYTGTSSCTPPPNMSAFDVFIRNDGTLEDLYQLIDDQLVPYVDSFNFGGTQDAVYQDG